MLENEAVILFVDDDPKAGELMQRFSEGADYRCVIFQQPQQALAYFKTNTVDLIISDLRMPGMTGMELLTKVREEDNDVPFIIVTGYAEIDHAIDALRLGASDFVKKPFDMDELRIQIERTLQHRALQRENHLLRQQLKQEIKSHGMVGQSEPMQKVYAVIGKLADIRCSVIIEGESGTGKELVARAIHGQGQFAHKPFIIIDCGALSDTLLESELFGHVKGAFTGAVQSKAGLLEEASGGTVFLDEIGNISDAMQIKLLRVIQEQQITRVGGLKPVNIDVRFIVASNQNLAMKVEQGTFRHDLYHRLNVFSILLPPLREHSEDIPELVAYFIEKFSKQYAREVKGFDKPSLQQLVKYAWPGNVRELQNLVERHIALAEGPLLHLEQLQAVWPQSSGTIDADLPTLQELERRYVYKVLARFQDNREKTAATLGVNKSTLWRKLQQYAKEALADTETPTK